MSFPIRNPYNIKLKPWQTSTLSHSPLLRNRYVFTVAFLKTFCWIIYSLLCSFRSNYSTQRRRRYEEFISKNIWRSVDFIQLMLKWSSKFAPVSHTVLALRADSFVLCFIAFFDTHNNNILFQGKYQVSAELKAKEINNLKEELKSLQVMRWSHSCPFVFLILISSLNCFNEFYVSHSVFHIWINISINSSTRQVDKGKSCLILTKSVCLQLDTAQVIYSRPYARLAFNNPAMLLRQ